MKIIGPALGRDLQCRCARCRQRKRHYRQRSARCHAPHEKNLVCLQPDDAGPWYYNSRAEGPFRCTTAHDSSPWSMMRAYRSGGQEGVHWKYTELNDEACLVNWKYYSSDGQTLIAEIPSMTTTLGDSRRWFALATYRSGGVRGKQWEYCYCRQEAAHQ